MSLKTSFFNKTIIKNDIKLFSWVGILYSIFLFIILPFPVMISHRGSEFKHYFINSTITFESPVQLLLTATVPVFAALLIWRYLQGISSSSMIHSLPFRREELFGSHCLAGSIIINVPIIINGIILGILNLLLDLSKTFNIGQLMIWMSILIILHSCIFIICSFVAMMVGSTLWQFILSYVVLGIPVAIVFLTLFIIEQIVFGFNMNSIAEDKLMYISPLFGSISIGQQESFYLFNYGLYILYIIGFFLLGLYLYKKRNIECATDVICFPILREVIKYLITYTGMLLMGLYVGYGLGEDSFGGFIIGCIIGTFLAYFITEMFFLKSFKVWYKFKGFVIYGIIIALALIIIKFDITGYERRIPNANKVESVYFRSNFNGYSTYYPHNFMESDYEQLNIYKNPNNITSMINLHESIVSNKDKEENYEGYYDRIEFRYTLNNGRTMTRLYNIKVDDYTQSLKPIYESQEFKLKHNIILTMDPKRINNIIVNTPSKDKQVFIEGVEEIQSFLTVYREEVLNESFEDMISGKQWSHMTINITNDEGHVEAISIPFKRNFKALEQWFSVRGHGDEIKILPEEVSKIMIIPPESEYYDKMVASGERITVDMDTKYQNVNTIEVEDLETISFILEEYLTDYYYYRYERDEMYNLNIQMKNGSAVHGYISKTMIEPYLK